MLSGEGSGLLVCAPRSRPEMSPSPSVLPRRLHARAAPSWGPASWHHSMRGRHGLSPPVPSGNQLLGSLQAPLPPPTAAHPPFPCLPPAPLVPSRPGHAAPPEPEPPLSPQEPPAGLTTPPKTLPPQDPRTAGEDTSFFRPEAASGLELQYLPPAGPDFPRSGRSGLSTQGGRDDPSATGQRGEKGFCADTGQEAHAESVHGAPDPVEWAGICASVPRAGGCSEVGAAGVGTSGVSLSFLSRYRGDPHCRAAKRSNSSCRLWRPVFSPGGGSS